MKAAQRREEIFGIIKGSESPVSANTLAEKFGVSRQVIVQDIAILRANGNTVTATNRGYMADAVTRASRIIKCRHSLEELVDEGMLIIDAGGRITDVSVNPRLYGKISAKLDLETRTHVEELYRSLMAGASKPLMSVTDGYHYHLITAEDEETLDRIEQLLKSRGYLIET